MASFSRPVPRAAPFCILWLSSPCFFLRSASFPFLDCVSPVLSSDVCSFHPLSYDVRRPPRITGWIPVLGGQRFSWFTPSLSSSWADAGRCHH
ncbi:hypothetical protein JB92DRAFT_3050077 [Gautieria morchelliformis]|nr:hypothetical protein JB92DRAFT_3050077 [Gautieria morchelliformis]